MIVVMLIVIAGLVFLSSLVASQGLDKAPNKALLLSISLLGVWVLSVFGLQPVFDAQLGNEVQLLYSRFVFAVGALGLLSLVWFVVTLLSYDRRVKRNLRLVLLLLGSVIFCLCMSYLIIADVHYDQSLIMPLPYYGPLMFVYTLVVVSSVISIFYMVLWGSAREKEERRRQQIRIVGVSIALAIISAAVTNLAIPWLTDNAQSSRFVTISIFILMTGLSYAIIRHGLFDIKLAAVRSITYLLSLSALAALYYSAAYFISIAVLQERTSATFGVSPLDIFLALVLAFIFQPVRHFFDQVTNRIFYRDRYDTSEFLIRLGRILTSTTELHDILEKVGREIRQTLKASGILFIVYRDHHPNETVGDGISGQFSEKELSMLDAVSEKGDLLVVDRLRSMRIPDGEKLYGILSKKRVALVMPLVSSDEVIGYLMLGEHKAGVYTKQDTETLEAMANELVIAVQNARAVQAIRDLNAHLEQRINEATKELRKNNEELKRSDEAKDEFVSMASHQLRTPLTSVKGYISMVLEGDAGKITPMQKRLLGEAFTSSERMVHLIGDFLNVSRIQTGKFVLEKNRFNLADLVEDEVEGLKGTARARRLTLRYRKPSRFPSLYIDGDKVHQVIMNFIDNAIYYSAEDSTITVRLTVEDGAAVFEVRDTGIGVPKEEQERLFGKFFRATNARRQRPDGTGIGLFLAKKVIVAHGGSMIFRSKEGEGSTFGFRLPIKKLSEPPREK